MDDLRKLEAKGLARAKARSRRLRVSRIRSLTWRGSLVLFLFLWAVVFVQLASGNDPALNKIPKKTSQLQAAAGRPRTAGDPGTGARIRTGSRRIGRLRTGIRRRSRIRNRTGSRIRRTRTRTRTRTGDHLVLVTSIGPHLFWITSRAAGIAALVLSSASLCAGLLIRVRGERRLLGGESRTLHESLALATLAALAVHGLALLGDGYLHPNPVEISIPFTTNYRPVWTGIGIVAGWGIAILGLSYYARNAIGTARWRLLHRFIAVFWVLGIIHTIGAGTDAGQLWLLIVLAIPTVPAAVMLAGRLLGGLAERPAPPSPFQPLTEPSTTRRNPG